MSIEDVRLTYLKRRYFWRMWDETPVHIRNHYRFSRIGIDSRRWNAGLYSAHQIMGKTLAYFCFACLAFTGNVIAGDFLLYTSAYTTHFNGNNGLNDHQHLIGLEYQSDSNWVFGASEFKNSFNQQTEYLYFGKFWRPFDGVPHFHLKLTAGAIHGYKGKYQSKIPLNNSGTAPAIIPAIGIDYPHWNIELATFYAGAIVLGGVRF